tara:strand:- start:43 stop:1152 length:1110 start_codon:yes stop_codon:yes gene_type:complete
MKIKTYFYFLLVLTVSCNEKANDNNTSPLEQSWSTQYSGNPRTLSITLNAPTKITDEYVGISVDGKLSLVDVSNGKFKWSKTPENGFEIKTRNMLTNDNFIYLKFDDTKKVTAFNISNGGIVWNKEFDLVFDDFVNDYLLNGTLYLTNDEPFVSIIDDSGNFIDTLQIDTYPARSISVSGNQVFITQAWQKTGESNASGRILSYSTTTEELLWSYESNEGGFYFSPLIESNGILVSGTTLGTGEIVGLNFNGDVVWSKKGIQAWSLANSDTSLFINDGESIIALDIKNGQELWRTNFNVGFGQDNVFYFENRIYHSHGSGLFMLDANTGEIIFTIQASPDGSPFGNLTVIDGKVIIQSNSYIYGYDITP